MRANGWTFMCIFIVMFFLAVIAQILVDGGAFR